MAYIGKEFVLDTQENFQEYLDSLGDQLKPEVKQAIVNHKATVKLLKDGDQYTLVSASPFGPPKETKFKVGVTFDDELNGNKAKVTFTLSGDTLTQKLEFEQGSITVVREFSDNEVVSTVSASASNVTAKRIYKA